MDDQKILIPYNFTNYDQKALDFVIRTFSKSENIEITLFNAYMPGPKIDEREAPIMKKMHASLNYLYTKIKEQEVFLNQAKQKLVLKGFAGSQIKTIFRPRKKDIPGEIIDLAIEGKFNIIVTNRKPGKVVKRFFTESIFKKVINSLSDKIVCVVS
ncbi:hypothetical protein C6A37_05345 [Desulfobacteraceae bacterium SEEP-SAG9]|nr:hypothetical protein C6A37_05345 [Desulfobacteraceae bacterium SEEP-SAG9]